MTKFKRNTQFEYTLLDSAASVHVFHTQSKFTSGLFRRAINKGLRCGSDIIPIVGWGKISLLLLEGSQLLILRKVAYIPNFPLNLISLGCLQAHGFNWNHESGKIRNQITNRLVGTTTWDQVSNLYSINYLKGTESTTAHAYAALATEPNTQSKLPTFRLATPASADIWHRRMGHIVPLGLYKLGKECLGVRLRGKNMSQCPHCALSKITQQISCLPPANKATRPFHRVFVDWIDLAEG